jgi:hypothetical protein
MRFILEIDGINTINTELSAGDKCNLLYDNFNKIIEETITDSKDDIITTLYAYDNVLLKKDSLLSEYFDFINSKSKDIYLKMFKKNDKSLLNYNKMKNITDNIFIDAELNRDKMENIIDNAIKIIDGNVINFVLEPTNGKSINTTLSVIAKCSALYDRFNKILIEKIPEFKEEINELYTDDNVLLEKDQLLSEYFNLTPSELIKIDSNTPSESFKWDFWFKPPIRYIKMCPELDRKLFKMNDEKAETDFFNHKYGDYVEYVNYVKLTDGDLKNININLKQNTGDLKQIFKIFKVLFILNFVLAFFIFVK